MSRLFSLPFVLAVISMSTALACSAGVSPTVPIAPDPVIAQAVRADAHGATLLAGFRVAIDPDTLTATVTPHRTGSAQPPQGQRYDLDIANFQNADSFRVTGVQVLGSGNFRINYTHAHPFPAPNIANPATGTNRADLGYTGRLLLLTGYNPRSYFTNSVRLSAGAVIAPDGYVETGDLLANTGPALVTAYPYKLLADEALDNREGVSNDDNPSGSYASSAGGWQRVNLGASGDGWTGFDYVHGGQIVANQFTLDKDAIAASNFLIDVALLIQYTDPRGAGGATHRLPAAVINSTNFAYRLPYAALDGSKTTFTANLQLLSESASSATLEVRVRDWDALADEAGDSTVGDEGEEVDLVQAGASGVPEVVLEAPGILTGLRNMGTPTGSGQSDNPLLYVNDVVNQEGAIAGDYFACLRITDPEFSDTGRGSYHAGVDATTLIPSPSRAISTRTWQIVPILVIPATTPPIVSDVRPNGIVGAVDEPITFEVYVTGQVDSFFWDFGGGARVATSTEASPDTFLGGLPGTFTGTVVAINSGGTSLPFEFTYRVLDPQKPDFLFHEVQNSFLGLSVTDGKHLLIYNGRPVVLYAEFGDPAFPVFCAQAQVANPQSAEDWSIHEAYEGSGTVVAAEIINNRLAFATVTNAVDNVPVFVYATTAQPTDTADWIAVPMRDPVGGVSFGFPTELIELQGRAFSISMQIGTANAIAYAATTATPTTAADFVRHTVLATASSIELTAIELPEGRRVALIVGENANDRARLLIATEAVPNISADYTPDLVFTDDVASVAIVAGNHDSDSADLFTAFVPFASHLPRVTHWRGDSATSMSALRDVNFTVESTPTPSYPIQLGMHNGRPVLLTISNSDFGSVLWRARRQEPLFSDWERADLSVGFVNRITLTSHDNRIAIFGDSGDSIVYGLSTTPW